MIRANEAAASCNGQGHHVPMPMKGILFFMLESIYKLPSGDFSLLSQ